MVMQNGNKRQLREFYENEAEGLSHQEMMYLKAEKHELWYHRKRLSYVISYPSEIFGENDIKMFLDVGCAEGFYVKYVARRHSETFCQGSEGFFEFNGNSSLSTLWRQEYDSSLPNPFVLTFVNWDLNGIQNVA